MSYLSNPAQHSPWRWLAIVLLLVNAAIHVNLTPMHLMEAPYIGLLFIVLSAACVILAALLAFRDNELVWMATGALSALALIAFLASRTVGLPQIDDDIGNWTEPLGILNMAVEALTALVTFAVLWSWREVTAPRATTR
ncbi:MAG: hypothetical protein ABI124_04610 [Terrimesophilobacter sp.]